ncbi:MAG: hypothetical protein RMY29_002730 [Nostoc sp. CreGUA01]|nr:hypothetical protein [Nostoc sp. CreGUA01]
MTSSTSLKVMATTVAAITFTRTRGRGDVGTRGHGDAGTRGRGDAGTRGRGDVGTRRDFTADCKLVRYKIISHIVGA